MVGLFLLMHLMSVAIYSSCITGEYAINIDQGLQVGETSDSYYDSECDQTELDMY